MSFNQPHQVRDSIISKHILEDINKAIINTTQINQWKIPSCVLKWFNNLENKKSLLFISFDVCDFYPSKTEKLLNKALDFASKYRKISKQERDIISYTQSSHYYFGTVDHGRRKVK